VKSWYKPRRNASQPRISTLTSQQASSKVSSRAGNNSSLLLSTSKTTNLCISTIESGSSQCIKLMNQVCSQNNSQNQMGNQLLQ
jgi:hypothetical protein